MTYRTGFTPIAVGDVQLRSDAGWGCTLRRCGARVLLLRRCCFARRLPSRLHCTLLCNDAPCAGWMAYLPHPGWVVTGCWLLCRRRALPSSVLCLRSTVDLLDYLPYACHSFFAAAR